jgi:hypothetical protein
MTEQWSKAGGMYKTEKSGSNEDFVMELIASRGCRNASFVGINLFS